MQPEGLRQWRWYSTRFSQSYPRPAVLPQQPGAPSAVPVGLPLLLLPIPPKGKKRKGKKQNKRTEEKEHSSRPTLGSATPPSPQPPPARARPSSPPPSFPRLTPGRSRAWRLAAGAHPAAYVGGWGDIHPLASCWASSFTGHTFSWERCGLSDSSCTWPPRVGTDFLSRPGTHQQGTCGRPCPSSQRGHLGATAGPDVAPRAAPTTESVRPVFLEKEANHVSNLPCYTSGRWMPLTDGRFEDQTAGYGRFSGKHYDTKFWWGWFESLRCIVRD